jgi:hypothetical protein
MYKYQPNTMSRETVPAVEIHAYTNDLEAFMQTGHTLTATDVPDVRAYLELLRAGRVQVDGGELTPIRFFTSHQLDQLSRLIQFFNQNVKPETDEQFDADLHLIESLSGSIEFCIDLRERQRQANRNLEAGTDATHDAIQGVFTNTWNMHHHRRRKA